MALIFLERFNFNSVLDFNYYSNIAQQCLQPERLHKPIISNNDVANTTSTWIDTPSCNTDWETSYSCSTDLATFCCDNTGSGSDGSNEDSATACMSGLCTSLPGRRMRSSGPCSARGWECEASSWWSSQLWSSSRLSPCQPWRPEPQKRPPPSRN
jgi:hypothetical protein